MRNTVQKAIEVAQQRYSAEEWHSMQPRLRTEAIYEVLRRLDAEDLASSRARRQPRKDRGSAADPAPRVESPRAGRLCLLQLR